MKVLFIHRSVGHHLIIQGNLRGLLGSKNVALDDYDNNSGVLTCSDGKTTKDPIEIPGNNTNPDNFAGLFTQWPTVLDRYNMIMIKSCYPNSHIRNEAQLSDIKNSYKSIIKSFKDHNKQLVVLTSPPLRPFLTNQTEAKLSSELADWLVSENGDNVQVFDLNHLLAEAEGRHKGMLKREYCRLIPFDNHPNSTAHKVIALKLVKSLSWG